MSIIRTFRARISAVVPAILLAVVVAGCSNKPIPPCPGVRVDSTTASLTKFRDGPGRDVTDIEYQAQIVGYKGECVQDDEEVEVIFDVDFALAGGPAGNAGPVSLYYFVAIPQFFPSETGKKILEVKRTLQGRATTPERFTEKSVRVKIPLKKDQPAASYDVYIGFQLTAEQLDYNRAARPQ